MDKWRKVAVGELQLGGVLLVEDGNHGEYRPRPDEFVPEGVAFIRAADMHEGRVLFESASKINARARQRITKGIGSPGDILLSHKGTVGKVAVVRDDAPAFVCSPQTTFWRTLDPGILDRGYLYAFLRSAGFHAQLAAVAGETDMAPYVSLTSQRRLLVALPPIETQRAIGVTLAALDDKIELNRKMSATLEAVARALFKSWFVDFDPVRAKAEGRDPGLPTEIAALFPDSFEANVPQGWSESSIYDLADVTYGAAFASSFFNENGDGFPLIRIRDLRSQNPSIYTAESHPRGYLVQPGDLLVGMDGEFRPYMWCGAPGWMNQRVCCFRPKPGVSRAYVHFAIEGLLGEVERSEAATTVIHLGKSDIELFRILRPPLPLLQQYADAADEFERRVVLSSQESRTLRALRDALLPKLISGELRVGEAERVLAASA